MHSGWYILGEEGKRFEQEFANYIGVKFCVGVANGLEALHLILRAYDIGEGDEVIVPSNTYIATWLAVSYSGAKPVPVEPAPFTYNLILSASKVHSAPGRVLSCRSIFTVSLLIWMPSAKSLPGTT